LLTSFGSFFLRGFNVCCTSLLNAGGQSVTTKFTTSGTYGYYCEPHQGAGMQGKVVVK